MRVAYYHTLPLGFTPEDLQRICYHLERAEKGDNWTDEDVGTLLKAKAMVFVNEEEKIRRNKSHGDPGECNCR